MTAPKPPDNKTLVGLPNELKAILERPRTPPPVPAQRSPASQPAAAPQAVVQSQGAMDRTLIGIPSEMQAALERALAEQAASPRARSAPRPLPVASAQVEVPPVASGSVLRVQAVRTIGVSSEPPPEPKATPSAPAPMQRPRVKPARRSPPPQQLPPRPDPARRSAPPQPSTAAPAQPRAAGKPSQRSAPPPLPPQPKASAPEKPRATGQSQLTSPSELLAQSQITAQPFLAPNAPMDWPPAQRRSDSGYMLRLGAEMDAPSHAPQPTNPRGALPVAPREPTRKLSVQPMAAEPSVIVAPHELEHSLHLHLRDEIDASEALPENQYDSSAAPQRKPRAFELPPGLAHAKTKRTKAVVESAPKRWPAIALIGLAVVAFACVIVLRAPNLLPAPLAAALAPEARHGQGESAEAKEGSGTRALPGATTAAAAVAPVSVKPMVTDTSAAINPTLAPPSPTRPPASAPSTSGMSAQLEKKAIEHLVAGDYPAALQTYERLRSAEPNRPEFGVMVELLTRTHNASSNASACGQPGQPACTGAVP